MKSFYKVCLPAVAAAFALSAVTAMAQSNAAKEDKAQTKADQSALKREEMKLKADTKTQAADCILQSLDQL